MTSKHDSYQPLLPPKTVIILPLYHRPNQHRFLRRCLYVTAALLLISSFIFLYPSDPTLQLSRIRLNHIRVNSSPKLTLDVSISLTIKVHNRDFFSLDYDSLDVSVGYRGRELGLLTSNGGRVRARARSYVDATLELDGLEVIHDGIYLIEDLARGVIPFDTDTRVKGQLGLFFFKIPLKARVLCEVYVNTKNQTIVREDCHPEASWRLPVYQNLVGHCFIVYILSELFATINTFKPVNYWLTWRCMVAYRGVMLTMIPKLYIESLTGWMIIYCPLDELDPVPETWLVGFCRCPLSIPILQKLFRS